MKSSIYRIMQRLAKLNRSQFCLINLAVSYFTARQKYRKIPWPARLALLHGISTFATLAALPPAQALPPVALPLAWATSLCFTIILFSLVPAIRI